MLILVLWYALIFPSVFWRQVPDVSFSERTRLFVRATFLFPTKGSQNVNSCFVPSSSETNYNVHCFSRGTMFHKLPLPTPQAELSLVKKVEEL